MKKLRAVKLWEVDTKTNERFLHGYASVANRFGMKVLNGMWEQLNFTLAPDKKLVWEEIYDEV